MHDGIIFAIGRTHYGHGIRIQADDLDTYDVIIESATEADQGLYECQALPSHFRTVTYLWVDGMTHQSAIRNYPIDNHGTFPVLSYRARDA